MQRTLNFDLNIGFLRPNCVYIYIYYRDAYTYRQLERLKFCELIEFARKFIFEPTLRRLIIVQGGLITSTGVVLVVLVLVFIVPGGGFSGNRRSGKPLRLLRLKNRPPDYKNQYQDHPFTSY